MHLLKRKKKQPLLEAEDLSIEINPAFWDAAQKWDT
jgi:hypothetical protein